MACQVCSEWLGSGVSKHFNDLKRVQQLLVTSLDKLKRGQRETSLYGEAVATMESLAVLKAWAELYIKVSIDDFKKQATPEPELGVAEGDDDLIEPHLPILSEYWLSAVHDHAQLTLPYQFNNQLPSTGGVFYTAAMATYVRPYYEANWSSILEATSLWVAKVKLNKEYTSSTEEPVSLLAPPFAGTLPLATGVAPPADERHDTFYLLMGVAIQALCNPALYDSTHTIKCCLTSIHHLIQTSLAQYVVASDSQLLLEILNVLHRVVLTSRDQNVHLLSFQIALSLTNDLSLHEQEDRIEDGYSCSYTLLVLSSCVLLKPSSNHELISLAIQLLPNALHWVVADTLPCVLPSVLYIMLSAIPTLQDTSYSFYQSWKDICHCSSSCLPILQSALKTLLISKDTQLIVSTRLLLMSILLTTVSEVCPPSCELFKEFVDFLKNCLHDDTQEVVPSLSLSFNMSLLFIRYS